MSIDTSPRGTEAGDEARSALASEAGAPAGRSTWSALRPLVLRIHFYAGVLIAPLLLVAAFSGLLYALSYQAEEIVYRHELTVPVGEKTVPLSEQVRAARDAHPEGTVTAVRPSAEDDASTRVLMSSPEVDEGESLAVFVDPYTAEVRGELTDSAGALPLRAWLSELHVDLHLGDFGHNYSEMAASWLWVVALGGVLLWIGRKRSARRALTLPERGATGRRRTLSRHGVIGLWAAAGLVALSATGLTWSTYAGENIGMVQDRLGGATPSVSAAVEPSSTEADGGGHEGHHGGAAGGHDGHAGHDIGIDRAVAAARSAGIDTDGPVSVVLPAEGEGYVVAEADQQFPVHLDSVAVNPADGKIIDELRFAEYPLLAKLTRIGIDAHMGVFLGMFNQLALAALAVALILLIVWSYRMWWHRRPTKDRTLSFGRPMPRGAWRKVPLPVLLPLAVVTALAGWFVPMLGISLLVFLAVDLLLGFMARARARSRAV
ncbi:PepSY-associated TM helix domain-containing protein [Streptomyces sannanensis]|uniref:PepSY-associated TM helix domain-containing protein n=1 Tax=Streptomyces sannanensis TaxID=285536 RepID=A0ABP6S8P1_9ACTN